VNRLYPYVKELFLTKQVDWTSDPIKLWLIDTAYYTFSTAHQTIADIPATGTVAVSGTLAGRTATNGVADADNIMVTGAPVGRNVQAGVLAVDSGTPATSYLVAYVDEAPGIPFSTDGDPIVWAWDNGTRRVFKL
jgi:hypothetical protein